MSQRKFEVVLAVITRDRITVKVMDSAGSSIKEERRRCSDGTMDCVSGNFEDEPDLSEVLHDGLATLVQVGQEVMEVLI